MAVKMHDGRVIRTGKDRKIGHQMWCNMCSTWQHENEFRYDKKMMFNKFTSCRVCDSIQSKHERTGIPKEILRAERERLLQENDNDLIEKVSMRVSALSAQRAGLMQQINSIDGVLNRYASAASTALAALVASNGKE